MCTAFKGTDGGRACGVSRDGAWASQITFTAGVYKCDENFCRTYFPNTTATACGGQMKENPANATNGLQLVDDSSDASGATPAAGATGDTPTTAGGVVTSDGLQLPSIQANVLMPSMAFSLEKDGCRCGPDKSGATCGIFDQSNNLLLALPGPANSCGYGYCANYLQATEGAAAGITGCDTNKLYSADANGVM